MGAVVILQSMSTASTSSSPPPLPRERERESTHTRPYSETTHILNWPLLHTTDGEQPTQMTAVAADRNLSPSHLMTVMDNALEMYWYVRPSGGTVGGRKRPREVGGGGGMSAAWRFRPMVSPTSTEEDGDLWDDEGVHERRGSSISGSKRIGGSSSKTEVTLLMTRFPHQIVCISELS